MALRLYRLSIKPSRETTRPALRISCSRISNSRVVTSTGLPSQVTSRVPGSSATPLISTLPRFTSGFGAPQNGLDARRQLARVEGLGKIIVGAQLEADDAIHVFAARGQHQHRDAAGEAQPLEDFETVQAGQHDIQHDQVIAALLRGFQRACLHECIAP